MFLGRPIPASGDPLWLDDDRAWALALLQVEGEACRGCGQSVADSTDPALEEMWRADVIRCHACAAAGREMADFQHGSKDVHGAYAHVSRREALPWQTVPSQSG
ncbi:hypothetical protein [Kitasatospora sp. CB02891]|uniref:hypothetical protein n=1 Tax=Kitasatospora sp. CB02891 TaxID=2020329 RepID=UPI000C280FD2|nr:hypothetical protein [Kitasatospora sp. CB02891]PJN24065.1 hypothetical protein CG736_19410 [Kitasatospora sp. CB02891]